MASWVPLKLWALIIGAWVPISAFCDMWSIDEPSEAPLGFEDLSSIEFAPATAI